jgi:hypothetical protein
VLAVLPAVLMVTERRGRPRPAPAQGPAPVVPEPAVPA